MIEQDTVRLLRECDAGAKMGADAIDDVVKDVRSGGLRDLLLRYLSITGKRHPQPPEKCTIIACADHGVAAEGGV